MKTRRIADLHPHYAKEFQPWLVLSAGEAPQPASSKDEALASAKEQADDTPALVLAVYRLEHLVTARVQKAQVFDPPASEPSHV